MRPNDWNLNNLSKNIKLAKTAGFCYGVKRAVETTKKLKSENPTKSVCVLGELIHNQNVIHELESLGIKTISDNDFEEISDICVIRSHGASPSVFETLMSKNAQIVDMTCPDVKKVQQKAIELVQNGFLLIILGKSDHPEVIAIKANAQKYSQNEEIFVVSNLNELKELESKIKTHKKVGVVIQTTQKLELLKETVNYLIPIVKDLRVFNTICPSTTSRQNEAKNIAKESDLMIVVGSKKSANTTHLAEILKDITNTIHIESQNELYLYKDIINNAKNIGVTAGASTPDNIIENVILELKKY